MTIHTYIHALAHTVNGFFQTDCMIIQTSFGLACCCLKVEGCLLTVDCVLQCEEGCCCLETLRESTGEIPRLSTRFSLSMENEQANAGRDGRTCLARPNSQPRTGTGKCSLSCLADHEQDWQPYPIDPYSAIYDHTYIHIPSRGIIVVANIG